MFLSKANQVNTYSDCGGRARRGQLLSQAVSSSLSQLQSSAHASELPKVDDLVLGQIVTSNVGQWKVPLQQGGDPDFFMPLELHIFAEPPFSLVVIL